jgi:hypothetical protein
MSGTAKTFTHQYTAAVDSNVVSTVGAALELDVSRDCILSAVAVSGTHAAHVIKLQLSTNATTWYDTTISLTGVGFVQGTINSRYARFKVTTAEGAASVVNVSIQAK